MAKAIVKSKKVVVGASIKGDELIGYMVGTDIYFDNAAHGVDYYVIVDEKVTFKVGTKTYTADQVEIIFREGSN